MKILIADDDYTTRAIMKKHLTGLGDCDIVVNGDEAIRAFKDAHAENAPYDLICLDIMMPKITGLEVIKLIRSEEESLGIGGLDGVKIIMTTAVDDTKSLLGAFRDGCEAYIIKPVGKEELLENINKLNLLK